MKEIKAYIRVHIVHRVIRSLEEAGFTDMTVIDVRAIRRGLEPEDMQYSVELAERYMSAARLEIVVRDQDVEAVTRAICDQARTGTKGDGLIYVSTVEDAMHIRTGLSGESAVESPSG